MRVTMTRDGVAEPFTAHTPEQVAVMEKNGWKAKNPTKEDLVQAAEEAGLDVPPKATKEDLERLVSPEAGA